MVKLTQIKNELTILCAKCAKVLGQGYTYGYAFYCDPCLELIEVSKNTALPKSSTDN